MYFNYAYIPNQNGSGKLNCIYTEGYYFLLLH